MRKSLVKKIASISIIAVVLALVVTTIILALVPKSMDNPIMNKANTIVIYQDDASARYTYDPTAITDEQKEVNNVIDTIMDLHEESLKDNVLSAIFQGTGKFKIHVTDNYVANVISTVAKKDGNCIVFNYYGDTQVLKFNDEVYIHEDNGQSVTFDMIVMPLGSSDSFEECTIYLANSETNKSSYQLKFLAHQSELNDYISSLDFGANFS